MAQKSRNPVTLHLAKPTLDNLIELSTRLTVRAPTPEEIARARAILEERDRR